MNVAKLQAPTADGGLLIHPAAETWRALLRANLQQFEPTTSNLSESQAGDRLAVTHPLGLNLPDLRQQARQEILSLAERYTAGHLAKAALTEITQPLRAGGAAPPLILAGHQPEWFHLGVWAKNFVLHHFAQAVQGVAINLVVDGDLPKSAALRVPGGTPDEPHWDWVAFDAPAPRIPYEEWLPQDPATFASFANRTTSQMNGLVGIPWLKPFVDGYLPAISDQLPWGLQLAQARHRAEVAWGVRTLELPMSWLARSESFCQFAAGLLLNAGYVHQVYNGALQDYRATHHLRSTAHPAPNLAKRDRWQETPLWGWTVAEPRRQGVFVRRDNPQTITLQGLGREPLQLPAESVAQLGQALCRLPRDTKLRPRALLTTLFARAVVGDLFIHGLGGAKYDEVTDQLCRTLLQTSPPHYAVVTATCRLPIPRPRFDPQRGPFLKSQLWHLRHHPERFVNLPADPPWQALLQEKGRLLSQAPQGAHSKAWRNQLAATNAALQPCVAEQRQAIATELARWEAQRQRERILGSRDYAFCLFPEDTLLAWQAGLQQATMAFADRTE